jgi:sigma-B regulation protein RsbU (phosphoserine phosphatase)
MFGYHWLDPDHLAVYLLDVRGHGVGSSLLAVSATNLLSARSLPDTDFRDPGQVLGRLNDVFPMEKQNNKYFTMWYGVYRRADRTLAYSNAGHPPALLFTGESPTTATRHDLKSTGLAIGMCEGIPYPTKTVTLGPHARMLIYSDGVYEIEKTDGVMWRHQEFVDYLSGLPADGESVADRLLVHVRQLRGAEILADDFSILEVRW